MNQIKKTNNINIQSITKAMLFHSGEPYATSTQIAKYFGIPHKNLLRKIREFESFEDMIGGSKLRHQIRVNRGKEYPYFELDADAYAFICLSISGKKAEQFKWAFIEAFKKATVDAITARVSIQANQANDKWLEARDSGKDARKSLSDKIKEFCQYAEDQREEPYGRCPYFKLITDAIYKYLAIEAPKGGKAPRDIYSGDVVEAIEDAELETIQLLDEIIVKNGTRKDIKTQIINRLKRNAVRNQSQG